MVNATAPRSTLYVLYSPRTVAFRIDTMLPRVPCSIQIALWIVDGRELCILSAESD